VDALRESENRFRVMADSAPVMIWMSGTDKLFIFFSKGWLDFTGRALEQELGNGWSDGVHPEDHARCLDVYGNAFDARQGFRMEYRLRRHDGAYRWVLDTGVPRFALNGTFLGFVGSCMDITESKNAEERFRLVVEAAPSAMIMVNPQGRITMANAQAEAVFGYSRPELLGLSIEKLIPEHLCARHGAERPGFLADPPARAMGVAGEFFGQRKNGSEVPLEISLSPIETPEGRMVLASIIDVSERKQIDDRMKRERAFLRQVIDINPNLIFAKDRAGRFTLVNQAVADVYGTRVENIVGETDADFNPNVEEVDYFRRSDQRVMDTLQELFIPEEHITDAQGKVRWLQTVKRPILDRDGRASQVLGTSTDITERKQTELEMARQRSELAHLSRVTMLGELSGSLAHELSQPLTAILSNAQAALRFLEHDAVDLNEVRAILNDIVADDKRAGEVIRSLRLLFKKGEIEFQPLDVNDLVRDVLRLVRGDLLHGGIALHTELAPALPMVSGDRVQLQQVLINLVINGCEAMADNARGERLLVIGSELVPGEGVRVTVTDRGHGIPPENLHNVFEAFFTTKPQGLGLGLAVCRTIISAHGGRLSAADNAGRGTRFQFTLPVKSGQQPVPEGH
jgi:PAS domain S-box-containing protein